MPERASTSTLFRLDGRTAVITGAGGAFGRAIARGFAEVGARLFLTDVDTRQLEQTAELVRADGGSCLTCQCDTGSAEQVEAAFARLDEQLGQVDVLVNNAGKNPMQGRPEAFPL